jgi:hypothetical protein
MEMGILTTGVAIFFSFSGMLVGYLLGRGDREEIAYIEIEEGFSRLKTSIEELQEYFNKCKEVKEEEIEAKLEKVKNNFEELKLKVLSLRITPAIQKTIEEISSAFVKFTANLPEIDESLLVQINDNLLIVRSDLERLLIEEREKKKEPEVPVEKIKELLKEVKSLNEELLKTELNALSESIKGNLKEEVVKALDRQVLTSKKLAQVVSNILKEVER